MSVFVRSLTSLPISIISVHHICPFILQLNQLTNSETEAEAEVEAIPLEEEAVGLSAPKNKVARLSHHQ
jgi:hypothetical protein